VVANRDCLRAQARMEIIKKISPAGPVGAAKSGGDAVCRCIAATLKKGTSEAPAGPAPHFRSGPDKSRITNPLVTGSLLDRFYRYTWPGPPESIGRTLRAIHDNWCNAVPAFVRCGHGAQVAWVVEWPRWRNVFPRGSPYAASAPHWGVFAYPV
jgi:hypothetical protein